jgi:hypothetical protein
MHADGRRDRQTDTDRQADVTNVMIAFRDHANAPKNEQL